MENSTYYLFDGPTGPRRWITDYPSIDESVWWDTGMKHAFSIPVPIQISMDPLVADMEDEDIGPEMPPIFMGEIPLFRDDFIAALKECGVGNLDLYAVELKDPDDGKAYSNYKAVNIIGIFPESVLGLKNPQEDIHTRFNFDHAKLDSLNKNRILMFRIENTAGIFVHSDLKECLASKGFSKLKFIEPKKAAL